MIADRTGQVGPDCPRLLRVVSRLQPLRAAELEISGKLPQDRLPNSGSAELPRPWRQVLCGGRRAVLTERKHRVPESHESFQAFSAAAGVGEDRDAVALLEDRNA